MCRKFQGKNLIKLVYDERESPSEDDHSQKQQQSSDTKSVAINVNKRPEAIEKTISSKKPRRLANIKLNL